MKKSILWKLASVGVVLSALAIYTSSASALNGIVSSSLGVGSRGTDVSTLQSFLAGSSNIYPAGLVTGYYGSLTQAAVNQLQITYGITGEAGRLGPVTMALVNGTIASGLGLDVSGPYFYNISAQVASNNVTLNWTSNELTRSKIYYDSRPLVAYESNRSFQEPTITGSVVGDSGYALSHAMTLTNLQSQTTYYYIIEGIDRSGNPSVTTQGSFRTNN